MPAILASRSAVTMSRYIGSPRAPGSFVRSSTAIALTVAGSAFAKCSRENGRYRRTFSTPTFSPFAISHSTASCVTSAPEPITMTTRSASGCPA